MADVVQYRLERMVKELDDLERRGLFSRQEIAEIVKQRRKFEYRLKRPNPLKEDFLAYIEYEKCLDSLRFLRKKMLSRELKENGNMRVKKGTSDFAGISRILDIYRLAVTRYKGDINLWFQYLEYCRERKKNVTLRKVLSQVINYHPKVPGVYIYAAAWEFDHNLNFDAARSLMMCGLRLCPTSEDLWVEYLRMELTRLNKLVTLKVALGEDVKLLIPDFANDDEMLWRAKNKDVFMPFSDGESKDLPDIQTDESNDNLDVFREKGFNVLRSIYIDAVGALPSNFSLRKKFLEILNGTDLTHSEELQELILGDMKREFETDPEYWDWLAKLEMSGIVNEQEKHEEAILSVLPKVLQIYEEALKTVPSSRMFELYINFLMDAIILRKDKLQQMTLLTDLGHSVDPFSYLILVFKKAETMGYLTEDLACQHVSIYLQSGKFDDARKLVEKYCSGKHSLAVKLWILRVSIEMRCLTVKSPFPCKDDLLFIFNLLRDVLVKVSVSEAEDLWIMALKFFANNPRFFEKLVDISLTSLAKAGGSEKGFSLSVTIINFILQKGGIHPAREMYKRFLALPHPGLAIYKKCIEIEVNLVSLGVQDSLPNARKLYESALAIYHQDASLWQDFYSMETKMGTSETSAAVYWRARKTLKDVAAFTVSPFLV